MDDAVYVGQSQALHWWPVGMVAFALLASVGGDLGAALVLLVPALVVALVLPWRFAVLDAGIALWFPFGKYRYLAKDQVKVRVGHGSPVLIPRPANRLGYPLTDGLVERRGAALRAVLREHGYDIAP
jgi:hypothetical protein